ncbi:LytTR family DNA-binding domain-containing protein [Mucilaginibacter sp. SMC90]|uniref:LytR/AlgR family response regulator transcription factor n=1 Tax=Mucilaginibacter sp. SMC90 TaxID=2929803 RepID=UPI001FB32124|nr:LytTR family DNA-binding domain-containing protein [Mucilaginibacter sp. SMC90]UOE47870.1 LytTR family DNA-binding domain-containing protein [Mucilaginibacter sp. SMC90]
MMRCLLVDDEKLALELMEDNVRRVPFLQLQGICKNAMEATEFLRRETVDLIFLDIQMPGISGLQFLKCLINPPMAVLVTAYKEHALDGFNLDVTDYLLKPFSFERFLKAANKARELHDVRLAKEVISKPSTNAGYIFVNADYAVVRVNIPDIIYVEGLKDYVKIYLTNSDRPVITRLSMHAMDDKLGTGAFARVHRSYIVSLDKVTSFKSNRLMLRDIEIPVSDNYKDRVLAYIGHH